MNPPAPRSIHGPSEEAFGALLALIVEGSTDGMFVKDLDGRYLLVNAAAAGFIGRDAAEILGRRDAELFSPETAEETVANDRRVIAAGGTETYESTTEVNGVVTRYLATKFSFRDVEGRLAGIIGIARDITSQKNVEDALRTQRDLYEALVGAQGDLGIGLVVLNASGRPTYANDAFCRITGYTREEHLARPSLLPLAARSERTLVDAPRADFEGHSEPERYEATTVRKDGARITVTLATKRLGATGNKLVMIRDVTEEKRARAQLMTAERLSAVGRLAAGVAHEINNPLAYVVTSLDEIDGVVGELTREASLTGDAKLASALERLRNATHDALDGTRRVTRIVRDMGTFSRAPDATLTVVDVRDPIRSALRLTDNTVRHRARVELDLQETPPVLGDEGRLAQLFVNLFVNGAQAIPEKPRVPGVLSVRTSTDDKGRAVIEVSDNGTGIAAEHLPHVFDPFFTTKPTGSGTGLGLSVSMGIVGGMGGALTVTSAPGEGSTFRIVLPPAVVPRAAARSQPAVAESSGEVRRARILIVDDEAMLARSIRRMFVRDHDVEVCVSSREALLRLSSGEHFDLVLCDLMMPELSGEDLYAAVSAHDPAIAARFVFITGGAVTARAQAFLERLENTCLAKPIVAVELRAAVHNALQRFG